MGNRRELDYRLLIVVGILRKNAYVCKALFVSFEGDSIHIDIIDVTNQFVYR